MSRRLVEPVPRGLEVPKHVAIIPDGNRRWAKEKGLPAFEGHRRGFEITPKLVRAAREMGIHTLTIWAFSTENWNRSKEEVAYLMKMYEWFVDRHLGEAKKEGARIYHLGRKDRISKKLLGKLEKAERETAKNTKYVLNVALDYGGHDEILRAIGRMNGEKKLTEDKFADFLDTKGQPYPDVDLVIRTSGEQRTSGLFSWQAAYSEFYFEKEHFPDFTPDKLRAAVIDYGRRVRRFGGN